MLSLSGTKMARTSGLRRIMDDIATTVRPGSDWLNLSIGNPAPIPDVLSSWRRLTEETLAESFSTASCLYGPSRGAPALVEAIVEYFGSRYSWPISEENVVIGPGSQLLCFIAASLFTGAGPDGSKQVVLPMMPDYTGYQGLCLNPDGIAGAAPGLELLGSRRFRYSFDFDSLEQQDRPGLLLLSSPSNPTGRCVEEHELTALVDLAVRRNVPLMIDHAYGEPFPQIAATNARPRWHENVINCFTLSKAGIPGERIGFAIGAREHIDAMVSFLSNSALHAPQLMQLVVARSLRTGAMDSLVSTSIRPFYRGRRQLAERLLEDILPDSVDWRLHEAEGGMFCWLWINHDWFDDSVMYELLKQRKVFVAPGRHFFIDPPRTPYLGQHRTKCFRISLSASEESMTKGIEEIGAALLEMRDMALIVDH